MQLFNLSATLNFSKILYNPSLVLPTVTISSFDQLKLPINGIKGIVLDKDNCISKDHDDKIWPSYSAKWSQLTSLYPKENLLIVSNSAGTNDDLNHKQAKTLEKNTGVSVLIHSTKKPGCYNEILTYFEKLGVKNNEILVIGDRLFTDILMANLMGSYSCWINEGIEISEKVLPKIERDMYGRLKNWGYKSPMENQDLE
ncbi:unnamed protein product [Candida verbasci]|uniref:Phosphatidylglycerophosphatase GEP4, mitochondrial n=1 Tax=Candida verbasci TaxID=1227364 RepID=A0A9W4U1X5_9ASCO|nr:unnamed protein product [Candida verbasci]